MELKAWMLANSVTWATIGTLVKVLGVIAIIVMAIMGLIYVFYLWKTAAVDTCQAITIALLIVATAILLIGIITGNVVMIVIAIVMTHPNTWSGSGSTIFHNTIHAIWAEATLITGKMLYEVFTWERTRHFLCRSYDC